MKLLSLAVASIVDANTSQGYTSQFIGHSSAQVADHIERGRTIRSKSVAGLFSKLSSSVSRFIERVKAGTEKRRAVAQLSRMNVHLLRDIGLTINDVENLSSGLISLDDLTARRTANRTVVKAISRAGKTTVDANIREIESANEEGFGLAKCC